MPQKVWVEFIKLNSIASQCWNIVGRILIIIAQTNKHNYGWSLVSVVNMSRKWKNTLKEKQEL